MSLMLDRNRKPVVELLRPMCGEVLATKCEVGSEVGNVS